MSAARQSTIKRIERALQTDRSIGSIVWWDGSGVTQDLPVPEFERLRQEVLEPAGLRRYVKVTPRRAINHTLKYYERGGKLSYARIVASRIVDNEQKMTYQLTRIRVNDGVEEADPEPFAVFSVYKDSGHLVVHKQATDANADESIAAVFNHYLTHVAAADLIATVRENVKDLFSVALRPEGGVYFVPHASDAKIHALSKFLSAVGGVFCAVPVPDDAATRRGLTASLSQEIHERLEYVKTAKLGEKARLRLLLEIRNKVLAYESILSRSLSHLHEAADQVERLIAQPGSAVEEEAGDEDEAEINPETLL